MDEERVKNLIKNLIIEIGEDPTREGLRDTPKRIAKMYKEIFGGYESDSQIGVQFSEDSDTVIVKNIEFYSMCEHHMLPFFGKIHIAYLPNGRVFGVSKLIRLVEKYSKRLQIQERLTKNIADDLYSARPCVGWIIRPNIFKAALLANISASMLSKSARFVFELTTIFTYVFLLAEMDRVRHSNACANNFGCCSGGTNPDSTVLNSIFTMSINGSTCENLSASKHEDSR